MRILVCAALIAIGCGKKAEQKAEEKKKPEPETKQDTTPPPADTLAGTEFETPESVLHDEAGDVYVVSNIAGNPADKDGNGFLSRISPDGKIELRWVEGLDAPKGSAIAGDTLYVADIDQVRMFDRATGEAKGTIAIEGATFLNDVAAAGDTVYVSDTGIRFGDQGTEPTGTDAIYAIATRDGNKVTKLAGGKELGNPNGLAAGADRVTVVTFGSGEMYDVVAKEGAWSVEGKRALPKGQLDGIVIVGDAALVSSWEASAIFEVLGDGTATEVVGGVEAPADIGFDRKRGRILLPRFTKNAVETRDYKR
jgi:hypothetical protein